MRYVLLLTIACSMLAADPRRLHATLLRLADLKAPRAELVEQLADEMLAIAPTDRAPALGTLRAFAGSLVDGLRGRMIYPFSLQTIEAAIGDILKPSGSTMTPASRMREALSRVTGDAAETDAIILRMVKVGEEVRGPDDLPILPRSNK